LEGIVLYSEAVTDYFNRLVDILFKKGYFGFRESAKEYVQKIKEDIENFIHLRQHQLTPPPLNKYGKYYCSIRTQSRTTWFVIFNKKDNRYLIKFITNNHTAGAAILSVLT
jgi:hypothetical protein